jgi:bifunctional non-homologous end joining protein LigD
LARYYERVAEPMLVHLAGRPLTLERFPDGIEGPRIMQQRASSHFPSWIPRVVVGKAGGEVEHVLAPDAGTLVYLAGQACIAFHRWLSRRDRLERPDRMVIDLDPSGGEPGPVRRAAMSMRGLLSELGLESWVMSTGSRGYHVIVPLRRTAAFDEVRAFARELAAVAAAREPRVFTVEQRKAKREGPILLDVMRNAWAHTAVAPYAVRARPGGPVATPLHWEELEDSRLRADAFKLTDLPARLEREGDPWSGLARGARTLGSARRKLGQASQ